MMAVISTPVSTISSSVNEELTSGKGTPKSHLRQEPPWPVIFVIRVLMVTWSGAQQAQHTNNSNGFCLYVPSLVSKKKIMVA